MLNGFAVEMESAEQRAEAKRHAVRQRRATACVTDRSAGNGPPARPAAPTVVGRRWTVRLIGFVPAPRANDLESI